MISEHTRLCKGCRAILPEATDSPSICPACDRVTCPPIDAWPRSLTRWLLQQQIASFFAPFARMSRQRRYERLLVSVIAGKQWSGRIVPRAVDVADAWQVATSEAQRWEESGSPPLYE
jgi:hypothetical protein